MTPEQLDEIKKRADAATPGPWIENTWCGDHDGNRWAAVGPIHVQDDELEELEPCSEAALNAEMDAEFIAHARTDIPALLAEVERLQKQVQKQDAELKDMACVTFDKNMEIKRLQERERELKWEWESAAYRANDNFEEVKYLREKLNIAKEALEELSKPPYKDSDLKSLVDYHNGFAKTALEKLK